MHIDIRMFCPHAKYLVVKVKGKVEAGPAPSKNSGHISMGFHLAEVFKIN